MKTVILCGGKGTRMREITEDMPKPMALIGGRPILWHLMKIYQFYGCNDFVFLLGYKGDKIKEYFLDYHWKNHNFVLDSAEETIQLLGKREPWKITFVDTGLETMTGSRIKRARNYIGENTFMLTYGDGLSNINILNLLQYHKERGKIATVTGITPKSQYGTLIVENGIAKAFQEKPQSAELINGGFFVFNKEIFDYLDDDTNCILEQEPMKNLAKEQQLAVYNHKGFWLAMDTYKDITLANEIWDRREEGWKTW
ncbi:MAG: rfbF [Anaerosolibacter sp.]|jgi:glucose-1-phosphate cytidylyltransferase|uniref:glucose-1-phosphate cytidylyltransferase n=1 Tax=Anaerosolibacter sp. TaxID=1872527 RepID=UPI00262212D9|nr:glucose-1-phosphate cytidylyltransferase [Anaerosolibacter sp.]MDF2546534.1 rfbF [Anaerosolibacter sp.]